MTNFAEMDAGNLARQLQFLNVKLIIMQFGVNVVPYETESYKYYERMYYNQLMDTEADRPEHPGTGGRCQRYVEEVRDEL